MGNRSIVLDETRALEVLHAAIMADMANSREPTELYRRITAQSAGSSFPRIEPSYSYVICGARACC